MSRRCLARPSACRETVCFPPTRQRACRAAATRLIARCTQSLSDCWCREMPALPRERLDPAGRCLCRECLRSGDRADGSSLELGAGRCRERVCYGRSGLTVTLARFSCLVRPLARAVPRALRDRGRRLGSAGVHSPKLGCRYSVASDTRLSHRSISQTQCGVDVEQHPPCVARGAPLRCAADVQTRDDEIERADERGRCRRSVEFGGVVGDAVRRAAAAAFRRRRSRPVAASRTPRCACRKVLRIAFPADTPKRIALMPWLPVHASPTLSLGSPASSR